MMTPVDESKVPDRAWLRKMGEAEDLAESVGVGGLAQELGMIRAGWPQDVPRVLGRLVQLARRARGLTVEKLAEVAKVSLGDLVAIEDDERVVPRERTVTQLAAALGLSSSKLLEIAGLKEPKDAGLTDAAIRFKARCEPTAKLSHAEEQALREFSQVLAEAPGKT